MKKEDLLKKMISLQDLKYRDMQKKIIPTVNLDSVIGMRTPDLRALAKEILKAGDYRDFLEDLPHKYFEENQLHAFIISGIKDIKEWIKSDKSYTIRFGVGMLMEHFLEEHQEPVTDYDEGLVRRLIEQNTVFEDRLAFEFKCGLETEVQM